ncbi:TetR/AcrR family transcriptional regulator [Nocardia vaccinii]|uniref:TetR/AcrR family transcriptional regulator n=1 Tax=Nocardia vaccinii TaxID=1822 RepID=UPI00082C6E80|nr:TetR/AcrR family transcriptional regulator [Nocardia vaccinii]
MPSLTRTSRARGQRDGHREAIEHRVLAAVDRLLSDGTAFTEIAVQRIAGEADMARSTFYRYFPDKSRLLIRMAELATDDLFGTAERWWSQDHSEGQPGVCAAMRAMIAGARAHGHLLQALIEVAAYDREVGAYWQGRVARFIAVVCDRLVQEKERGRIDASIDPASTAIVLTAMVERSIQYAFFATPAPDDDVLARTLGRTIWLTVYGERATPSG